MKIRRFVAADMRSALQMVREAHGPDAVILSNRRTDEGVEIVAASNYDEGYVQRAIEDAQRDAPAAAPPLATMLRGSRAMRDDEAALAPSERWLRDLAAPPAAPAAPTPQRAEASARTGATLAAAPVAVAAAQASAPVPAAFAPPAELARFDLDGPTFAELLAAGHRDDTPAAPRTAAPVAAAPRSAPEPARAAAPAPVSAALTQDDGFPSPSAPEPAVLSAVPSLPVPSSDRELAQMRDELAQMRMMIEREMARLTDERLRGSPARAQAMELMEDYGFDAGITRDTVLQIPADTPDSRVRGLMLALLSKRLPVCPIDPLSEAGVIALVGPTGAGKTTTIAKLAALYASQHQARDIALVTTDTSRIGGREQLHSYGRQLGIAVHEADSETGLVQLLQKLEDYKLVLVDTAGLSQRDRALAGQLNWLRAARNVRTLLVLPANTHFADLDEVVRRFDSVRPQGVVLTKLDETGRLGSALSVAVDHQLPLTWVTDGQRVPEDLHRANAAHLVLRLEDLRRDADKPIVPEHTHAVA
ncbi:flagellar biosynthesis protein FlhF [Luteimonas sp. 3794]|uniref:flagellar biosynthesis protein FlhF n=1 Tax=Luteimonas sp. 3794 TaxID=2817730 RepID=UPI002861C5BA|nr:flagellar biosynthesis protein FlhF [Luteimonas sp. 3794]MDR6990845.1 flagellar biosynthesis protein FlhF [Luteimonas sp. 3794]